MSGRFDLPGLPGTYGADTGFRIGKTPILVRLAVAGGPRIESVAVCHFRETTSTSGVECGFGFPESVPILGPPGQPDRVLG